MNSKEINVPRGFVGMTQHARKHSVWKMFSVHELHCGAHDDQECGGNFQRNSQRVPLLKMNLAPERHVYSAAKCGLCATGYRAHVPFLVC